MTELTLKTPEAASGDLPIRLHHNAYVVADQARTRHFYEDVVGLPLIATWIEAKEFPAFPGRQLSYAHTFYGIGDGGALAFFEFADEDAAKHFRANEQDRFVHIALAVTQAVQDGILARLNAEGCASRMVDHGYCNSLYVSDPDGLLVEFTVDPEDIESINAWQKEKAHDALERWIAGDRTVNNDIRKD